MKPFTRRYQPQPKPTPAQVLAAMRATAPTATAQAAVEALGERWGAKEAVDGTTRNGGGDVPGVRRVLAPRRGLPAVDRPAQAEKPSGPVKEEGVFTCDVPIPPRELAPNARPNRWEKAKVVVAYQKDVQASVLLTYPRRDWPVFAGKVRVSLTFVFPTERRIDLDNCAASFKAGLDCLVHMGVLKDDGHKVVESIAVQRRTERGQPARVVVEIRGVAG